MAGGGGGGAFGDELKKLDKFVSNNKMGVVSVDEIVSGKELSLQATTAFNYKFGGPIGKLFAAKGAADLAGAYQRDKAHSAHGGYDEGSSSFRYQQQVGRLWEESMKIVSVCSPATVQRHQPSTTIYHRIHTTIHRSNRMVTHRNRMVTHRNRMATRRNRMATRRNRMATRRNRNSMAATTISSRLDLCSFLC